MIFESLMMALKVLSYASNEYFRPTLVKKEDKKLRKKLARKGFDVRRRVVFKGLFTSLRLFENTHRKQELHATQALENGRVGHRGS